MKDQDSIILENLYIEEILKENAPRQRSYVQGAWDRMAGAPLEHSTSIARNQLIDMYKKVWKEFEDDWESNNAIARNPPIPITLDYLADFLQKKYSQIDTSKIVDPLALEYAPTGNFNDELDEQTIGDFLYDTLSDYYESVGGLDQGSGNLTIATPQPTPQPSQQPQPTPQPSQQPQPTPQPSQQPQPTQQQPTPKKYKLPRSQTRKKNDEQKDEQEKKKTFWGRLKAKQKADWKKTTARTKSQIRNT